MAERKDLEFTYSLTDRVIPLGLGDLAGSGTKTLRRPTAFTATCCSGTSVARSAGAVN